MLQKRHFLSDVCVARRRKLLTYYKYAVQFLLLAPKKFTPFTDRLSRDIRNSLSEAFVASLKKIDQSLYQNLSHKWLSKDLASIYNEYIQKRLQRYEDVFKNIQQNHIINTGKGNLWQTIRF